MGVYLSKAKTEKASEFGGDTERTMTRFGLTSMQGWRQTMEDAHLALPEVEEVKQVLGRDIGVYGVFDGHGGPAVSAWIAKHLIPVLKEELEKVKGAPPPNLPSHLPDPEIAVLCETLCKTFIELDKEMETPGNINEIKQIHESLMEESEEEVSEDDEGGGGIKKLLSQNPKSVLQAILGGSGADGQAKAPIIKFIEQNGEQFFQITPAAAEESEQANFEEEEDEKHEEAADEKVPDRPLSPETIVEDPHVTAPELKSPRMSSEELNKQLENQTANSVEAPVSMVSTENMMDESKFDDMRTRPGMPDTCGAAVVLTAVIGGEQPYLVTANAGDSRCVLCRNGKAVAQSHDHKPNLSYEMRRITNAGGTVHHGRVDGNLNLSRTLGDLYYKRDTSLPPEQQKITAYPDILVTPLTAEDEFVIVACDGIWDCVTNQRACDFVRERLGENPTPEHLSAICEALCDQCLAQHPMESEGGIGCDNMTCIIVLLNDKFRKSAASCPPDAAVGMYYKDPEEDD